MTAFLVPAAVGLVTIVLQAASGATLYDDEMGYLGEAVYLSARHGQPILDGIPFYPAGYPALLAVPLSVVPADPWVVAVGLNVVLLAAIGPILYWTVRRLGTVSDHVALIAAVTGASVPSVVLQAPRAWSEVAVALGVTVWAALLLRWSQLGPGRGAVPVAVSAGAMFALHRRTVTAVILTFVAIVLWSLWQAVDRRRWADSSPTLGARLRAVPWVQLVAALVAGGLVIVGAMALDAHIRSELYGGLTSGNRLRKAQNLTSTVWIPTLLGHLWSVLAVTFGLAGVGLLVSLGRIRRRGEAVFHTVLLLAFGGITMTSVTFLANGVRADQLVYERYVAPLTPVLVAIGVAALASQWAAGRWAAIASGVALAVGGGILSISLEESRLTGNIQKFSVPALTSLDLPSVGWDHAYASKIHVLAVTALTAVHWPSSSWPPTVANRRGGGVHRRAGCSRRRIGRQPPSVHQHLGTHRP